MSAALNDDQRAHLAALAAAPDLACPCGWQFTEGCRTACCSPAKQRPEDRAFSEGYQAGRATQYRLDEQEARRLAQTWGSALPPDNAGRCGGQRALWSLLAGLRTWAPRAVLLLTVAAGAAQAREPERRTFHDERGHLTGRSVQEGGTVRLYDDRGRSAGTLRRSGDGWRAYDWAGRPRGSIREQEPQRARPMGGMDGVTVQPWTGGRT